MLTCRITWSIETLSPMATMRFIESTFAHDFLPQTIKMRWAGTVDAVLPLLPQRQEAIAERMVVPTVRVIAIRPDRFRLEMELTAGSATRGLEPSSPIA